MFPSSDSRSLPTVFLGESRHCGGSGSCEDKGEAHSRGAIKGDTTNSSEGCGRGDKTRFPKKIVPWGSSIGLYGCREDDLWEMGERSSLYRGETAFGTCMEGDLVVHTFTIGNSEEKDLTHLKEGGID